MNMKRLRVLYPWKTLAEDEAFFVPALDAEKVYGEGIRAGIKAMRGLTPTGTIGCFAGRWGVLFSWERQRGRQRVLR